jgi:hypothetical protein
VGELEKKSNRPVALVQFAACSSVSVGSSVFIGAYLLF